MKDVMSVRLDPEGFRRLRALAKREKKEVSAVARELMDYGWVFLMLREYRAGRRSLGNFAQGLNMPLSDAIDLLADLGVRSPLEYDDYLKGYAAARELIGARKSR
jgi:predicted transcriptional regulator